MNVRTKVSVWPKLKLNTIFCKEKVKIFITQTHVSAIRSTDRYLWGHLERMRTVSEPSSRWLLCAPAPLTDVMPILTY